MLYRYQYQKKLYCMYHIHQEEDSIGVTLVVESVLLGEQVFVLDLVIILLLRIKTFVSPLARFDLSSSTSELFMLYSFRFGHIN